MHCPLQDLGASFKEEPIPDDLKELADEWREKMLDEACSYDEGLMEAYLEGEELKEEDIVAALRIGMLRTPPCVEPSVGQG